ncbi:phosphonatase-like hydrolase [Arthrobacter sp. 18067]|uniref:phosphonatase-like hydrolase n=1 Tax=Arthrobacter sp. 18067 TaxID=2681413 RepID=UPI001359A2E6|nr:phosphonatase-like hydrolase [Arthrobacter sp. 18067]
MIKLVCLDMAGTTVQDGGVVKESFLSAVTDMGLATGSPAARDAVQYALDTMGQSKIDVFMEIFGGDSAAAGKANSMFEAAYERNIDSLGVSEISGAAQTIRTLRQAGTKVVLTTGFSPVTRDRLISSLGWGDLVDDVLSPADAGRGRPAPDMILTAMLRFGIDDVREIAVAGDTTSDLLAGTRSGASVVAGVLTGAHTREDLQTAPHTHILNSVTELPGVLLS